MNALRDLSGTAGGTQSKQPIRIQNTAKLHRWRFNISLLQTKQTEGLRLQPYFTPSTYFLQTFLGVMRRNDLWCNIRAYGFGETKNSSYLAHKLSDQCSLMFETEDRRTTSYKISNSNISFRLLCRTGYDKKKRLDYPDTTNKFAYVWSTGTLK